MCRDCTYGSPLNSRWVLLLCLAFTSILTSGCAYTGGLRDYVHNCFKVGPEYCKPVAPVADAWIDSYDDRIRSELPDHPDWWTVFNDPILTDLVYGAYQQNLPLRVAGLRVIQARAQRGIAVGSFFPQSQEMFGSYAHQTLSKETFPGNLPGSPRAASTWQNGFDMGWELDLWGKFRRNIEAADASLDASIEDYDEILITLIADTAATYVEYRVVQQQLEYARANVKIQEGSFGIAQARFNAGQTSELDVTQARTNLQNTKRQIPVLENQLRITNNSLCILLGIPPRDLFPELGAGPIPTSPTSVVVGVPANLLRRRPDVLSAEREVAAQSARIGVAAADWFPSVTIAGSLGYAAGDLDDLYTQAAFTGVISPQFNWPILNYGRILNNVRVQDALFQQAAVNYQQTVLSASNEAENAINSFLKAQEALRETQASVDAAKRSVNLAITQYRNGATDYNRVYNLLLTLVQEQNVLAQTQGAIPSNLIAIYKALGGGWQIRYGSLPGPGQTVAMEESLDQPGGPTPELNMLPPVPTEEP
jgi:NodT family efflux transporter outer membrane factor (OMF) lipoprotein